MGLWGQVIGVRGVMPEHVPAETGGGFSLPWRAAAGWTWASIADDSGDLEEVAIDISTAAGAPVLAFLVADSDLAILYGAAPGEPAVVASTGWLEEPGPETQATEFAEWTERNAPVAVPADRFAEWAQTQFVFAEEGLAYLLAQMGLVEHTGELPETFED